MERPKAHSTAVTETAANRADQPRGAIEVEDLVRAAVDRLGQAGPADRFSTEFLRGICRMLVAGQRDAVAGLMARMTRNRQSYAEIADGLLAGVSRELGAMWASDEISFAEVGIGIGDILRLNRDFGRKWHPIIRPETDQHALFAGLRGQSHTLGLVLAAEAFRLEDWHVDLHLDLTVAEVLERVLRLRPHAIGLTAAKGDRGEHVFHLIKRLESLPFRPRVLLGGSAAETMARKVSARARLTLHVVEDIAGALRAV